MELPVVVGLHVCERVTVDPVTGTVSLRNRFTVLRARRFPTSPISFSVFAAFINGSGTLAFRVEIDSLTTGELLREFPTMVSFEDRLREVPFVLNLEDIVFPQPGGYQISLTVEDEPIARCEVRIVAIEEAPDEPHEPD